MRRITTDPYLVCCALVVHTELSVVLVISVAWVASDVCSKYSVRSTHRICMIYEYLCFLV